MIFNFIVLICLEQKMKMQSRNTNQIPYQTSCLLRRKPGTLPVEGL